MSLTLDQELKELSTSGLTVMVLKGLDFVIPGDYTNSTSLDQMIEFAAGDLRDGRTQAIANHVEKLYAEDSGAQRAVSLYKLTDKADKVVAAAALANKIGSRFKILSFLAKYTPKADTVQTIDLCLKLTVEALAYLSLHGLSIDGLSDWGKIISKTDGYSNESALRIAAIIGLDGLIPLGPDFLSKVAGALDGDDLGFTDNALFKKMADYIPGGGMEEKTAVIKNVISNASAPIDSFISRTGLTRDKVIGTMKKYTDLADDKLDYAAAFLDASTAFITQTGVQTVARHLTAQGLERFGHD